MVLDVTRMATVAAENLFLWNKLIPTASVMTPTKMTTPVMRMAMTMTTKIPTRREAMTITRKTIPRTIVVEQMELGRKAMAKMVITSKIQQKRTMSHKLDRH